MSAADKLWKEEWFDSLEDARRKLALWRYDYNNVRPHSSLENQTPAEARRALEKFEGPAPTALAKIEQRSRPCLFSNSHIERPATGCSRKSSRYFIAICLSLGVADFSRPSGIVNSHDNTVHFCDRRAGLIAEDDLQEIGALLNGSGRSRDSDGQITITELTRIAARDIAMAEYNSGCLEGSFAAIDARLARAKE